MTFITNSIFIVTKCCELITKISYRYYDLDTKYLLYSISVWRNRGKKKCLQSSPTSVFLITVSTQYTAISPICLHNIMVNVYNAHNINNNALLKTSS